MTNVTNTVPGELGGTNTHTRVITAMFDSLDAADAATDRLVAEGIARGDIRLIPGNEVDRDRGVATDATVADTRPATGFWESLKELFLPEDDRHVYAEGLSRGGYLVTVNATASQAAMITDILDQEGTIDVDDQEAQWRQSGWSGYTGSDYTGQSEATADRAAALDAIAAGRASRPADTVSDRTATAASAAISETSVSRSAVSGIGSRDQAAATRFEAGDTSIPVAEERLRVGKREVDEGTVRVRSYTVEEPVREDVVLRRENVSIDRRAVDRPADPADDLFRERTIEANQTAEEPVVTKDVRVKEEIGLRKEVGQRTETIADTVRRTEVDVDDGRGQTSNESGILADKTRIAPQMDVIAAGGEMVGRVDRLEGDRIKLTKLDAPDGQHHYVPLAWIDHIDTHVHLNKRQSEIVAGW